MATTNPFLQQQNMPQSANQQQPGYYQPQQAFAPQQQQNYAPPAQAPPPMQHQQYAPPAYLLQPQQQQQEYAQPQQQQYAAPSPPRRPQYAGPQFGDSQNPFRSSSTTTSDAGRAPSPPKRTSENDKPMLDKDGKPLDPRQAALIKYGSPFAYSSDWAPTAEDFNLTALPQRAIMMRIKMRFARTAGDIFNPPAPSFAREPSRRFRYAPFSSAIVIPQESKELADGFKSLYPGRILVDHDVSTADWARFLEDITVAGRLTGGQAIISQVAPLTMHMGATGYFVTKAIERGMKKKKEPVINEAVETWNQNFFGKRGLDVYLRHGNDRTSARAPGEEVPRKMGQQQFQPRAQEQYNYDSDNFSSSGSSKHKKHHKKDKKDKDKKKNKDVKWSLVIEPLMI